MPLDHLSLTTEFPQFKEAIHTLKMSNAHFAKLLEQHEAADKAIVNSEDGNAALGEVELENLKKQRIQLKDQLFQILNA
jgi:hypothetical protein